MGGRGQEMIGVEHFITNMPWYLQVLATAMAVLLLAFVILFLFRGLILWVTLRVTNRRLQTCAVGTPPDDLTAGFPKRAKLAHLWHEYAETLHPQRESGTITWRATAPAEVYFNAENIVDAYVGSEFFSHLPGVFTGMGIIGTFAGLISGLSGFRPTTDPAQTMAMIGPLIGAVREAFFVSAAAITAAMVITLLEKFTLAVLYGRTAKVANGIDRIFDAGIDEEYLARLTKATEEGTSQAKMLKDALVKDIGEILREVSKKQMEGISAAQKDLGTALSSAIQTGLTEPLNRMEETFKTMTGGTGERTVQMLGDVMASFSAKLSDLFGGQISGINELNKHSAEAMQGAAASLRALVEDMSRHGKETADQMAQKMTEAINAMELRQSDINSRTEATLEKVAESMRGVMNAMGESVNQTLVGSREREATFAQRNKEVIEGLGGQIDKAVAQMSEASQAMARSVEVLSGTTTSAIDKMNLGAEKVARSADSLVTAATGVTDVVDKAHGLGKELSAHSQLLLDGSRALQSTMSDYQEQRRAMQQLMGEAGTMVEAARKEASITESVLKRIEQSTQGLAQVHGDFDKYLDGVNAVLAESSQAFSNAITSILQEVNLKFKNDLDAAVNLLRSAIDGLAEGVEALSSARER